MEQMWSFQICQELLACKALEWSPNKKLYMSTFKSFFFNEDILKYVDIFRYFKIVTEIPDLQP